MAVAAAAALPATLQAGVVAVSLGGGDSRCPSRRYRKYELIGQGAQKKVYRAFDEERGIEVAWNEVAVAELARFREKDQQRVFAEIRVLKQLKHKNIMTLHDYWFDERRLMLIFITEIFPDGTLRQYRRRHKHADLPAIKRWAWQILQGLVYLHGHNPPIIHRDLKCDNIFVCGSSGVVKIGDLGLVTLCKDFSAPQSVLGTPEFMAPELYEEKYDEKVDVYAFGMCLLELATMEYPYAECKNAAQIYKKVTQGIPPASVEKLSSAELRDFVNLCLVHDPHRRPEARQLLKHSFFEAIRAAPPPHTTGGCGTPPKLTVVSSMSVSPSNAAPVPRPVTLTRAASATAAALVAAAAGALDELSPTALSRAASSSSGGGSAAAAELGCFAPAAGLAATAQAPMGSIAAAAAAAAPPMSSLLSARLNSVELPPLQLPLQQPPPGSIAAAALSPQPLSPIAAAANGAHSFGYGDRSAVAAMAAAAAVPVPAPAMMAGSIAAAASAPSVAGSGGVQLGVSPLSMGGLGSIASSLSPTTRPGAMSSAFAASVGGSGASSPGVTAAASAYTAAVGGGGGGAAGGSGPNSPASGLTAALQLSPLPSPGCGGADAGGSSVLDGPQSGVLDVSAATAGNADAYGRCGSGMGAGNVDGYAMRQAENRPSQLAGGPYSGMSASAAAIAAAAVSAAAAAVGASSGPSVASPLGLPSIYEDHELHEETMFGQEDNFDGSGEDDDGDDDVEGEDDDCGSAADSRAGAAPSAVTMGGGGRSQPVSLKVKSSGQAAISNMALSFAMSFTSKRGVRKKVGFQYDLLHDTAQNIAVEMVENLSLNTAEAEAIAAMIQHEVSRFNAQQQQDQQQQQ